ncbi:BON domain-containing protein [Ramlibacter henchirensis]|uniref:BON domain-containing protein n=1 Tax=Ramlibacter henchirensis TaxID=204072 RepID=A0A4Z0BYE0_9BURK|nr:BON domain-containing protein [Ramlibacter henchirensis]TFZ03035.1 BON domain-containing protein [Ramlibacter henchirensis]
MDIRPIGFAIWITSVVAVAACSPREDERDLHTPVAQDAATRATATRQQQTGMRQATNPASSTSSTAQRAGDPTTVMGGASSSAAPRADDAQITARVKAELAAARDLAGARIDVDTRDGVVTLSGPVRTAAVKARASEIARMVPDVRDVNDQLTLVMS